MSTLKTVNIQHPSSSTINGTLDTSGNTSFAGNLSFNSGYGSAATAYGCRAWVNFNGTGTPAIRASGNVSSITDGGTGIYTINFTNALPDANYTLAPYVGGTPGSTAVFIRSVTQNTGSVEFTTVGTGNAAGEVSLVTLEIHR